MDMTQEQFNDEVFNLQVGIAGLTVKVTDLIRSGDQDAYRMQHRLIRVQICRMCLMGYDLTSDVLTDDEISYTFEQAHKILQSCPS